MAKDITVTFDLSEDLLLALGRAARRSATNPSDYLRRLMRVALLDSGTARGRREDGVRLALAAASDWPDLQRRLRAVGCVLRTVGPSGDLTLCTWPRERPLLPIKALGTGRTALVLRFGADFPPGGSFASGRRLPVPPVFRSRRAA